MMYDDWMDHGLGWFGMGFGMLLFWGVLILIVVLLVRWLVSEQRKDPPPSHASALDILAQRYARGEIDRTEYEQKRRDLGG